LLKNGTCIRKLENGVVFRVRRYICSDCGYSFVTPPLNYGYGKHFPDDLMDNSIRSRIRTSLRKVENLFRILLVVISYETFRRYILTARYRAMASSEYFVYDEQYVHINGEDK